MSCDPDSYLIKKFGRDACVDRRVSGGSIAESWKIHWQGRPYFLKCYKNHPEIAVAECRGLKLLGLNENIFVPEVIDLKGDFLLLSWIESKQPNDEDMNIFGQRLARFHSDQSGNMGATFDNFIGSNVQLNRPIQPFTNASWAEFWYHQRLGYQIELYSKQPQANRELVDVHRTAQKKIVGALNQVEGGASLLHGDLWSGNYLINQDGDPCLIDPAVYYGHPEADIALTTLFGGFPRHFYEGYFSIMSFSDGYPERELIYQLYHVLNHLNLFGQSYYNQALNLYQRVTR